VSGIKEFFPHLKPQKRKMSKITGTHFNYYFICKRKLWLFANSIQMEHTSDAVGLGKLIQETSYDQRSEQMEEVEIDGIKIDYYDRKNKIIHEIKKSDKMEDAHEWQVKYYIYVLKNRGVEGVTGILEYPKLREKQKVILTEEDETKIQSIEKEIRTIINSDNCPPTIHKKFCGKCAYYDFCYINEEE